jgi:hypothetical protein
VYRLSPKLSKCMAFTNCFAPWGALPWGRAAGGAPRSPKLDAMCAAPSDQRPQARCKQHAPQTQVAPNVARDARAPRGARRLILNHPNHLRCRRHRCCCAGARCCEPALLALRPPPCHPRARLDPPQQAQTRAAAASAAAWRRARPPLGARRPQPLRQRCGCRCAAAVARCEHWCRAVGNGARSLARRAGDG